MLPSSEPGICSLSVVILALNEGANFAALLTRVHKRLMSFDVAFEIIVVDGGSTDETPQYTADAGATVVRQEGPDYANALLTGCAVARGQDVITMDADSSHDPDVLEALWERHHDAEVKHPMSGNSESHHLPADPSGAQRISRYRQPSQRLLYAVFTATVLIQLVEGHTPLMRWYFNDVQERNPTLVEMDGWERAAEGYEHLALYPVPMIDPGWHGCATQEYAMSDYVSLGYKAYCLTLTFNGGYVARIDTRRMQQYCAEFEREIQEGKLGDKMIYIVHPAHWERFRQHAPQATCGRFIGQIVCVSSQSRDAFRKILESQRIH